MGQNVSRSSSGSSTPRQMDSDKSPRSGKAQKAKAPDRAPLLPNLRGKVNFEKVALETAERSLGQTADAIPDYSSRSLSEDAQLELLDLPEPPPPSGLTSSVLDNRPAPPAPRPSRPASARASTSKPAKLLYNIF